MENKVYCPLVDNYIEDIECIENSDCIRGIIKTSSMPNKYKSKEDWEAICTKCQYYEL